MTEIFSGSSLTISAAETSAGLIVDGGASLTVLSGGTADGTTIAGSEIVSSGGTDNAAEMTGGSQLVYGSATSTFIGSGAQTVEATGIVSGATVSGVLGVEAGVQYVLGSALATTIDFGGEQIVESGGVASGTQAYGPQIVSSGGIAIATSILSSVSGHVGTQIVTSGGQASGTIVNAGTQVVSAGGTASGTMLGDAWQYIYGTDVGTFISAGGWEFVEVGGVASNTQISGIDSNRGIQFLSGTAVGATILAGGEQIVESGGTASNTVAYGGQTVSAGGVAIGATISSGAGQSNVDSQTVYGSAFSTTVLAGGEQFVYSGGVAGDTAVYGQQLISAGGTASGTTIFAGGTETVGGRDSGAQISGGLQDIAAGGSATGATIFTGSQRVESGATASSTTIQSGGVLEVKSGGSVAGTLQFASGGGDLQIDNGSSPAILGGLAVSGFVSGDTIDLAGIAYHSGGSTLLQTGNLLRIAENGASYTLQFAASQSFAGDFFHLTNDGSTSGGTAITVDTTPDPGNSLTVSAGQTSAGLAVGQNTLLTVLSGGTAVSATISGREVVSAGGTDSGARISGGLQDVLSGGGAGSATILSGGVEIVSGSESGAAISGGEQDIASDGSAGGDVIYAGSQIVSAGGSASGTTTSGGSQLVYGSATDTFVGSGTQTVEAGGVASRTTVSGVVYDYAGGQVVYGSALGTTVLFGGGQSVSSGGFASGSVVEGAQSVYAGGIASATTVVSGAGQSLLAHQSVLGSAIATTVSAGGMQEVFSGGFAGATSVYGFQLVSAGGTASGTTIFAGGHETASGVTSDTTIASGGVLEVVSGGTVAGSLLFAGSGGDLRIDSSSLSILGGQAVSGFVAGDTIDLSGVAYNSGGSASLQSGNVLKIVENGATYDLQLAPSQSFPGEFFHLTNDGSASGGTAITVNTTPDAAANTVIVSAGQTAAGLIIPSGSLLAVLSGGTADQSTVAGSAVVESGGSAGGTSLAGGTETVLGTDTGVLVTGGGSQLVYGSAGQSVLIAGTQTVEATGTASGVTLSGVIGVEAGIQFVFGSALATTVDYGGGQVVEAGGVAIGTAGKGGQVVFGSALSANLVSGGVETVEAGGLASGTTLDLGGQFVSSAGVVSDTIIFGASTFAAPPPPPPPPPSGGSGSAGSQSSSTSQSSSIGTSAPPISGVFVRRGGTVTISGGQVVSAGGTARATTLNGGFQEVQGTASGTTIGNGAEQYVGSGGTAGDTTIQPGGVLEVVAGGTLAGTLLFAGSGGDLQIDAGSQTILGGLAVSGFVPGDEIDLAGIGFSSTGSATLQSGNMLEIVENGTTYDLQLDPSQDLTHTIFRLSNDGLAGGTVISAITDLIVSAGQTSAGLILDSYEMLTVLSGGTAIDTTLNDSTELVSGNDSGAVIEAGTQFVAAGGTASLAQVSGIVGVVVGAQDVAGTALSTTILFGGEQIVESGGTASATVDDGLLVVRSGGTAADATVGSGGTLRIESGGTLAGALRFDAGGRIDLAGIAYDSGGTIRLAAGNVVQFVENGATYDLQLDPSQDFVGEFFDLANDGAGGTAITQGTTLTAGTFGTVSAGQTVTGATVDSGGVLTVLSGGSDSASTLAGGTEIVDGSASNSFVGSGTQTVEASGVASGATISGFFEQTIAYNTAFGSSYVDTRGAPGVQDVFGSALATTIDYGGEQIVEATGVASGTTIGGLVEQEGYYLGLQPDGSYFSILVVSTVWADSGVQEVYGSALATTIAYGGEQIVETGGVASGTTGHGLQIVSGSALATTIDAGGEQTVAGDGFASGTTIDLGAQFVSSAGVVADTIIFGASSFTATPPTVSPPPSQTSTPISSYSSSSATAGESSYTYTLEAVALTSGPPITGVFARRGGTVTIFGGQIVSAGATAQSTTLSGGFQDVAGTAGNTTIGNGAEQYVSSGGTASNTTIQSGGVLELASGGTLAGTLLFADAGGDLQIDGGSGPSILGGLVVSGFVPGDEIDLTGIAFDSTGSATLESGNTLQIVENGTTYDLQLDPSQSFANDVFYLSNDGMPGSGTAILAAFEATVSAGQALSGVTLGPESTVTVLSGGTASGLTLASGTEVVSGYDSGTVINAGTQIVASGGNDSGTVIIGGEQIVEAGGTASLAQVSGIVGVVAGAQDVFGTALGTTILFGGEQIVEAGGTAIDSVDYGPEVVSSGGVASSTTIGSGGELYVSSGGTAIDSTIQSGGMLEVASGGTLAGALQFAGSGGVLRIDSNNPAVLGGLPILGLVAGDTIDLAGIGYGTGSATLESGNTLQLVENGSTYALQLDPSQNLAGDTFGLVRDAVGGVEITIASADPGPSLTAAAPSVAEPGQSTVIGTVTPGVAGDTLSISVQSETAGGVLNLGTVQANGSRQVIYTAPTSVSAGAADAISYTISDQYGDVARGTASVPLDSGPTLTAATPGVIEQGQSTVVGTVMPGLAGDTLHIAAQSATAGGILSLGTVLADGSQQVLYTAATAVSASMIDAVSYTIADQNNGVLAAGTAAVPLDGGPTLAAVAPGLIEAGQSAVIGTVTPGLPGDTLSITAQSATDGGVLSLGTVQADGSQLVIYTAAASLSASGVDAVGYTVADQHDDVVVAGTASVSLDRGPAIAAATPAVVEAGQSTVVGTVTPGLAGDTLSISGQSETAGGTLSLGAVQADGSQLVIYTAASSVPVSAADTVSYTIADQFDAALAQGSATVSLDAGPTIAAAAPGAVEAGQSTVIGTVTPGLAADTLSITSQSETGGGTLSLGAAQADGSRQVIYTAAAAVPASGVDAVGYTIADQHNDVVAQGTAAVPLDAGPTIAAATPGVVEAGQSTVIGTVTPGLAGDTLSISGQNATAGGTLSLGAVQADGSQRVIYTATASITADAVDLVSYTIADQHNDVVAQSAASVQLDAGPTIAAATPSVVEAGQSTVVGIVTPGLAGDTLRISGQSESVGGALSLGAVQADGTQQVIYTAAGSVPASVVDSVSYTVIDQHNDAVAQGAASVQLDAGPTIAAAAPAVVEKDQSTVIGTVTPGLSGDTLTITAQSESVGGVLSLGAVQADGSQQVIYTAAGSVPASVADSVSYTVSDQHNDAVAQGAASVQLDAGPTIAATTPSVVENGQSTVIGTVTPGLAGDTLSITAQTASEGGTLSLGAVQADGSQQVIYTAAASVPVSEVDGVSYTVSDQHNDAVAQGTASVQLDAGPTIAAAAPDVVEKGQSTVIGTVTPGLPGDTLSIAAQTESGGGTLSLGTVQADGTQQVIYTAAASVPASVVDSVSYTVSDQHNDAVAHGFASVQLDAGPAIAALTPSVVEKGQSTVIGTVTPGLSGDTLNITAQSETDGGTLSLGAVQTDGSQQVIYTAAASVPVSEMDGVSYTISDQHNDAVAQGAASVQLDAGPTITAATPNVVEKGQSTVIGTVTPGLPGDTLSITAQAESGGGTLSLGTVQADGTQEVIYTAAGSVPVSEIDSVSYTISDQHNDAVTQGTASVQLDAGPTIAAATPSVVEKDQSTVIGTVTPGLSGDTLSITAQSETDGGTLSLGAVQANGTQQVIYTAAASVPVSEVDSVSYTVSDQHNDAVTQGTASVQLDSGPSITPMAPPTAGNDGEHSHGDGGWSDLFRQDDSRGDAPRAGGDGHDARDTRQTVTVAMVTPGLPGDTLTLVGGPSSGSLSLASGELRYTEPDRLPPNTTESFTFAVKDQLGGLSATETVILGGSGNLRLSGAASGYTAISLGNGHHTITLSASHNAVNLGDGNNRVSGGIDDNAVQLGNGNNVVSLTGSGNTVTLGDGNSALMLGGSDNHISLGDGKSSVQAGSGNTIQTGNGGQTISLTGSGNTVSLGNGENRVILGGSDNHVSLGDGDAIVQGGSGDTIQISATALAISGLNETVLVGARDASIWDAGSGLTIGVGPTAGEDRIHQLLPDPSVTIDLLGGIGGFTSVAQVMHSLRSDGHHGTLLSFGRGSSLDFAGVAVTQLHPANFNIG